MNAWRTLLIAVAVTAAATAEAQSTVPDCAQKLVPCLNYINTTTTPPSSCCTPVKQAVATQLTCLCNLYATPGLLQTFGINVTQAIGLSKRCGVTSDLSSCKAGSAQSPSSGTQTPPATPGGGNGADRVAFTGLSFLLLFWASVLFN